MKINYKAVALCAMLGMLSVSCQKEEIEPLTVSSPAVMTYRVDDMVHSMQATDEDLDEFLDRMFSLAEQGHRVSIYNGGYSQVSSKERVVYTTSSIDDAKAWSKKMLNDNYVVTIEYDEAKGIYTCIATK